jgi:hypothetical protein
MEEEIIDTYDYADWLKSVFMQKEEDKPFLNLQIVKKFQYYYKSMK